MTFFVPWQAVLEQAVQPAVLTARARNTWLDWLFYDIDLLTPGEQAALVRERTREGAILVVWPSGRQGIRKFGDHASLRRAPGALLRHFTIAGVGSSDVGAAAFARSLANFHNEPVGAIVAGYGMSDLLSEALWGWFVLGAANRILAQYQAALDATDPATLNAARDSAPAPAPRPETAPGPSNDVLALLRLLKDEDREILSITGHSKGCLSIAYGLSALMGGSDRAAIEKARRIRLVTTGAVVALPEGVENAGQYLGQIDWFGGMNSRLELPHVTIPGAWHHLNRSLPAHFDLDQVLAAYEG